jgi:subtilisin family serine protease
VDNEIRPWGEQQISVELCCQVGAGYDLYVFDSSSETAMARCLARGPAQPGCAVLRFRPEVHHRYYVRLRSARQPSGRFHLVTLYGNLEYTTATGSIPFPADGPEAIAVGAVGDDGQRPAYSSCGPNSAQPKPDLVAPVPFASLLRRQPFSGTSAAAPQAAALAALWWSRYPTSTAVQVREALRASAHDLGPPGHDYETGYGMIALP